MLFPSWAFLLFLAVLVPVYFLVPKRIQWIVLLLANAVFVCAAGLLGAVFMIVTIVTVYCAARGIGALFAKQKETLAAMKTTHTKEERKAARLRFERKRRLVLIACLVVNVGILFALKYGAMLGRLSAGVFGTKPFGQDLALTMGISFYTFSTVGYLFDVYREEIPAEKNPFKLALFTSFFPLLVQGPITRWETVGRALTEPHSFDGERFLSAALRITWGYWKKLIVADRLLVAVKALCARPDVYRGDFIFVEMLLYAACLYADFTGGIDITIGVGEMLGVRIEENFRRPYFSKSISEYWRRWHITLGEWFKRYVYYPLSVSKPMRALSKNTRRLGAGVSRRVPVYLATLLVWALTGAWHGSNLTFLVWGLLNGVVILLSEELKPLYARFHAKFPRLTESAFYRGFTVIRTVLLLSSLRILDCYGTVKDAFSSFFSMFTTWNWGAVFRGGVQSLGLSYVDYAIAFLGVLAMFALSMAQRKAPIRKRILKRGPVLSVCVLLVLIGTILLFGRYGFGFDASQFIYNRF
jgi:D-alanyl-lipoteichoic acid acyltransferase DltB (MBOAT superfamily)